MKNYEDLTKEEKELYDAVKALVEITKIKGAMNTKGCAAAAAGRAAWLAYATFDRVANRRQLASFVNKFEDIPNILDNITKTTDKVEKDTCQLYSEVVEIFTRIKKLLEISEE